MALLLARHAGDEVRRRRALAEHGELARVDASRAIFAGLVDAQHRRAVDLAVAGARRHDRSLHTSQQMMMAEPSDRTAFQPAMEIPRKANWIWSQRTNGVAMISARLPEPVVVQDVKPSSTRSSTRA